MNTQTVYPSLRGESVFVTGGATGIGSAIVESFARQGANVAFIDIDGASAAKLSKRLEMETGNRPWFQEVDVCHVPSLKLAIKQSISELGPFLTLVNNVANDTRMSPSDLTEKNWRDCLAVNLDAAFFASQAMFESMRTRGRGSIINLSSINAILGPENMPGYVTAKAGLLGMTKALARDFGKAGIRVNAVLPGWVVTKRQLDTWLTKDAEEQWMKQVAIKKRLLPDDIAKLVLFLSANDSDMITGQSFVIDGGRT